MIRAVSTLTSGRKALILGLDAENFRRLTNEDPLVVQGKPLGVDLDFIMIHGSDDTSIGKQLHMIGFGIKVDVLKRPFRAVLTEPKKCPKLLVALGNEDLPALKAKGVLVLGEKYGLDVDTFVLYGTTLDDVLKKLKEIGIELPVERARQDSNLRLQTKKVQRSSN